jgi:PAS domain S-box-containing protein
VLNHPSRARPPGGETLDGTITSWNPAAERLYGYTAEEMLGQPIARLAPPEYPNGVPAILARLRRGERITHYETVRVRNDTTRVDVSLSISPLIHQTGEIVGAATIARDITERKLAEAHIRELLLTRFDRGPVEPARVIAGLHTLNAKPDQLSMLVADMLDVSRLRTGRLPLRPVRLTCADLRGWGSTLRVRSSISMVGGSGRTARERAWARSSVSGYRASRSHKRRPVGRILRTHGHKWSVNRVYRGRDSGTEGASP